MFNNLINFAVVKRKIFYKPYHAVTTVEKRLGGISLFIWVITSLSLLVIPREKINFALSDSSDVLTPSLRAFALDIVQACGKCVANKVCKIFFMQEVTQQPVAAVGMDKDNHADPNFATLAKNIILGKRQEKPVYSLRELLAMDVTDLPCLFAPIFQKSGIAVLVGGSDAGKSTLLRQLAMSVATGRDFMGWEYRGQHHRALYFSSEDDRILTARVVRSYNRTMKLPDEALDNLQFIFNIEDNKTLAETLATMLKEQPADLVVIDALGDFFDGKNLNDNREVRAFYAPFKEIAKEFDCLIIFNHHTGKRTSVYAPDKDNSLGSQAIEATPRIAIELRPDPQDPDTKHFCIVKCNYLSSEYKTQSYVLRMDDNFVFQPTGERAEYSTLAKSQKPQNQNKQPKDFDNSFHRNFIQTIFADVEGMNQKTFAGHIAETFDVSEKTGIAKWIPYYTKNRFVEEDTKPRAKNEKYFKSLINSNR